MSTGPTDTTHDGAADRLTGVNRQVMDELLSTGAVLVGRRTFELGARTARLELAAGVLDELQVHLIPVLLGRAAGCSRTRRPTATSSNWCVLWTGRALQHLRYRVR